MSEPLQIVTDNYFVTHYPHDPTRVVVSFSSLGFSAVAGPIEEFKRSLERASASCIFVTDRGANWYNNSETQSIFQQVADLCSKYKHVGAVGESAGGCAAILFSNFYAKLERVLAFSPHFSIAMPFRAFDNRPPMNQRVKHYSTLDFSECADKSKVQLIYGNNVWQDFIHSSMYSALGFRVAYIEGGNHEAAAFLKNHPTGNLLQTLIEACCDFERAFDENAIAACLGAAFTEQKLKIDPAKMYAGAIQSYVPMFDVSSRNLSRPGQALSDNQKIEHAVMPDVDWTNTNFKENGELNISGISTWTSVAFVQASNLTNTIVFGEVSGVISGNTQRAGAGLSKFAWYLSVGNNPTGDGLMSAGEITKDVSIGDATPRFRVLPDQANARFLLQVASADIANIMDDGGVMFDVFIPSAGGGKKINWTLELQRD